MGDLCPSLLSQIRIRDFPRSRSSGAVDTCDVSLSWLISDWVSAGRFYKEVAAPLFGCSSVSTESTPSVDFLLESFLLAGVYTFCFLSVQCLLLHLPFLSPIILIESAGDCVFYSHRHILDTEGPISSDPSLWFVQCFFVSVPTCDLCPSGFVFSGNVTVSMQHNTRKGPLSSHNAGFEDYMGHRSWVWTQLGLVAGEKDALEFGP